MKKRGAQRVKRNPFDCIINRTPLAKDQTTELGLAYRMAFNNLINGAGNETIWNTLVCSINIAMVLCEQGFEQDSLPIIKSAQRAMLDCKARFKRINQWGLDGVGWIYQSKTYVVKHKSVH